jgi:hypothetical protein
MVDYLKISMKKIFFIASVLCTTLLFNCTKNDDVDENALSSGNLVTDSLGGCKQIVIHGTYQKDTALTADNYLDVSVNVKTAGTYTIETNTVNGMSFKGTGRLGYGGGNTVRLYGSGKPLLEGLFPFKVTYGGSLCIANISIGNGGGGTAIYSMGGAPNSCSGFNISGNWAAGQIIQVGVNYAVMNVNVTAIGLYQIDLPVVNGVIFSTGLTPKRFNTLGVQSVILYANGTPLASGSFNYRVNSTSTNCTFTITYL